MCVCAYVYVPVSMCERQTACRREGVCAGGADDCLETGPHIYVAETIK